MEIHAVVLRESEAQYFKLFDPREKRRRKVVEHI